MELTKACAEQRADQVNWNHDGLITAIAQDSEKGDVLMLAWMNREALVETLTRGHAVYWSRSRQTLWRKGESSGQTQKVNDMRLDCDGDAVLLMVTQKGVACHTGRRSCFFRTPMDNEWRDSEPVITPPHQLYNHNQKR